MGNSPVLVAPRAWEASSRVSVSPDEALPKTPGLTRGRTLPKLAWVGKYRWFLSTSWGYEGFGNLWLHHG